MPCFRLGSRADSSRSSRVASVRGITRHRTSLDSLEREREPDAHCCCLLVMSQTERCGTNIKMAGFSSPKANRSWARSSTTCFRVSCLRSRSCRSSSRPSCKSRYPKIWIWYSAWLLLATITRGCWLTNNHAHEQPFAIDVYVVDRFHMGCLAESVKATRGKATIDLAKLDKALGVCDIVVALRMLTDGPADMASVPLGSVSITSTSSLGTITATRPCTFEIRALSQFVVLLSKRNHAVPFSRPRAEPQYSVTPLRFVRALPPHHTTPTRMTHIVCDRCAPRSFFVPTSWRCFVHSDRHQSRSAVRRHLREK